MYENDYIMRLIKEISRTLLRLLFNINVDSPAAEFFKDNEEKESLGKLLDLVNKGYINEAENALYDLTENKDMKYFKIGLLFYSYLNEQSDTFLKEHGFSRDEIKSGIQDMISRYDLDGLSDMTEFFLSDQ